MDTSSGPLLSTYASTKVWLAESLQHYNERACAAFADACAAFVTTNTSKAAAWAETLKPYKSGLTLREQLDIIQGWLMQPGGHKLWNVMGGLRGPDHRDAAHLKDALTIHIRAAAFPKLAADAVAAGDCTGAMFKTTTRFDQSQLDIDDDHWHFRGHARTAANALGLLK